MRVFIVFLNVLFFIGCNGGKPAGTAIMPEIKDTDSVEILYFKEAGNQRFYTYIPSKDKDFINTLIADLDTRSETEKDENTCVKEGKIYMHKKGSIFNTVFFSYSDNSCKFLRFIKNGKLYYFPISENLRQRLKDYRPLATEPVANPK